MTYESALKEIANLAPRKWRLGIDRMRAFAVAAGLGDMLGRPNYVHVAGTNGKGSVTAYIQNMLVEAGLPTGAFFSPYVVDPRERVQIGRDLISKELFAELATELFAVEREFEFDEERGLPEFEFKTALGLAAWKRMGCEWVALEVGLGGRYDATNIVTPRCSVIVSIGYDHMHILGDTLAQIAGEKAGIIKPGLPVVMGQLPAEAEEVVLDRARELECPIWRFGNEITAVEESNGEIFISTPMMPPTTFRPGIAGSKQGHNAALAIAALQLASAPLGIAALVQGIEKTSIPGRFQSITYQGREVIVDGAHNQQAAEELARSLRQRGIHRLPIVLGMVGGHEAARFFKPLIPFAESVHLVPIDFHRAVSPDVLQSELNVPSDVHLSVVEGLLAALQKGEGPILVTGSLYLSGQVIRRLTNPS